MKKDSKQRVKIKQWSEQDRPREKLLASGRRALSDAELVAILIGSGSNEETAVELSKRILFDLDNDLNKLAKLSMNDLCCYKGIGEAKAISIMAAMELGRRRKEAGFAEMPSIKSSEDAYHVLKSIYADLGHEEFWVLLLNTGNKVIAKELVSKGGIGMVAVDIRLLFQRVLQTRATGLILSHNHPSGALQPSDADRSLTRKIVEAAQVLDIRILDHLIISDEGYYSFLDHDEL